jgi:hypothetical protein
MRAPRGLVVTFALVALLSCFALLTGGASSLTSVLVLSVLALLWGLSALGLYRGSIGGWRVAFGTVAGSWILLAFQLGRRAAFVYRERDLELSDGTGSPMAFLLGLTIELALLVALSVLAWYLRRMTRNSPRRPPAAARA